MAAEQETNVDMEEAEAVIERQRAQNGRVLSTVWPEKGYCSWLTRPVYTPSVLPQDCPVEVRDAITKVVADYRFICYATLYGRIVFIWMFFSLVVLLGVLFTSPEGGLPVLIFCLVWCAVLITGVIGCCIIRKRMTVGLRHCLAEANETTLWSHNLLLGVEDRGQLSCHKVVFHIVYMDWSGCLEEVKRQIRIAASGGALVLGGASTLADRQPPDQQPNAQQVQEQARALLLRYSQRYVKSLIRNRLVFPTKPSYGVSDMQPRHVRRHHCLCQFVQKNFFERKPRPWYERLVV